ncbi:hypothetical protein AYI69_g5018 [Smittium culicis]|uniref:Secreted protein n=1 Tax=Smittium culicis TaxID=133412 RepID=A0A1R1Y8T8_9FUNG|nr:hypothetical protein AYI69_g5018 [Smittium culicis]
MMARLVVFLGAGFGAAEDLDFLNNELVDLFVEFWSVAEHEQELQEDKERGHGECLEQVVQKCWGSLLEDEMAANLHGPANDIHNYHDGCRVVEVFHDVRRGHQHGQLNRREDESCYRVQGKVVGHVHKRHNSPKVHRNADSKRRNQLGYHFWSLEHWPRQVQQPYSRPQD